ncbi:hypothetical protein D3C81_1617430 [compost metagenome]
MRLAALRTLELRAEALEELEQRIVGIDTLRRLRRGPLGARGDADVHHGGAVLVDDAREVGRRGDGDGRAGGRSRDGRRRGVAGGDGILLEIGITAGQRNERGDTDGGAGKSLANHGLSSLVWLLARTQELRRDGSILSSHP